MKRDQFAFFNQQLAGMLRSGIPLEGALRQLTREMERGRLRRELGQLESDLANGVPLSEAIIQRRLPQLYVQLIRLAGSSDTLPGVLTMLADYYEQSYNLWLRLKGLLVYPVIALLSALGLDEKSI